MYCIDIFKINVRIIENKQKKEKNINNLLSEIKQLAQKGYENAVILKEENSKEIFLNIMLKTEIALTQATVQSVAPLIQTTNSKRLRTYERISNDAKSDMYLIGYCFSCFEHTSLYEGYSQDKAFTIAAEKLGVKKNTLKNTRDWFDGHNDSHRSGWWQAPLPEDMKKAKKIFDSKTQEQLLNEAKDILGIKK